MKKSSALRFLVAAAFVVPLIAPLAAPTVSSAIPALPLPAPATQKKAPKTENSAASSTRNQPSNANASANARDNETSADEPYIAPQNTDIPLHRNATPRATPDENTNAKNSNAQKANTKSTNAKLAPAGPLPNVAPAATPPNGDLARENGTPATSTPKTAATPRATPSATPNTTRRRKGAAVGGVSIEGLTDRAALHKLNRVLESTLRAPVSLSDGQKTWVLRRDALGATAPLSALIQEARRTRGNVDLRFNLDTNIAARALKKLSLQVNRTIGGHRDAIIPVGGVATRGSQRITLSSGGSLARVRQALEARPPRNSVALVVEMTPIAPATSSTRTPSDKPFLKKTPYLLAEFSTHYDSSISGRTTNLKLAARNVDGTIVQPGKIFSTNLSIGKRDEANGWKEAKMFMDGQVVDGIGSGICQCASTVYNAALLAGLPIIERHPHTFRVSYAPASRDATIYWGSKDMRFRNNTSGPIYVRTFLKNDRFHVELYGVQPVTKEIEVSSRVLSRKNGTRSEAFRTIKSADGVVTEKLSRDFYRPHP